MINLNNVDINLINKSSIKKINQDIRFSYDIKTVNMPNIEECKAIIANYANEIKMKSLKKCSYIRCNTAILDLPNLEYVDADIDAAFSKIIYLPKLKSTDKSVLYFNTAKEIYLDSLENVHNIECQNAKLLVVPKKFALEKLIIDGKYRFSINSDCEIVYTENRIKKESFGFKSFFIRNSYI